MADVNPGWTSLLISDFRSRNEQNKNVETKAFRAFPVLPFSFRTKRRHLSFSNNNKRWIDEDV